MSQPFIRKGLLVILTVSAFGYLASVDFLTKDFLHNSKEKIKQAGAELCQAQLQLELGFTLIKVCCIILILPL